MQQPPSAPQVPHEHVEHGVARPDPWSWLRDTGSPEVVDHLMAERAFYTAACAHLRPLVSGLGSEMASRLPPTELSPPWQRSRFSYYTEHRVGDDYPVLYRRSRHVGPHSETNSDGLPHSFNDFRSTAILEVGRLATDSGYLDLGLTIVSPDEDLLAYSVDTVGEEVFRLRFRDLRTGADLPEEVPRTYYGGAWSADSSTFFYTVHDDAYRPYQVWRHRVGTPVGDDELVLEEPDRAFELHLRASRSGDVVLILGESRTTSETWCVDAHRPGEKPRSVGGRRHGVVYRAEHLRGDGPGHLLIVTDDGAEEFRLVRAPVPTEADQDWTAWAEVRPGSPAERIERVDAFAHHVVLSVRSEWEHRLRVLPHDDLAGDGVVVSTGFPCGAVHLARTTDYAATSVLVVDRAHVHPDVWRQVDLATGAEQVVGGHDVPGHDPGSYVTERHTFPSPDGTVVPATVVRRADVALDGTAPALLFAYGAYEYTFEPEFDPALPSLLDRGVVYVHAHVRGGGEGGRRWWLDGRLDRKQNSFTDHCAVADGLAAGLVDGSRIATRGLSAGGLLQGVVLSRRPDRWRAVVAEVPFVDVVTTMLDDSIPLTVNEWEEWGDPRRPEEHRWLLAYSPYDNLPPAGGRPDLLVTGALHDPRVAVHEPAKWVAALRASDPEWAPRCVFRCEVGAGSHVGPSGRYGHLEYEAEVYAWVLDKLEVAP